MERDGSPHWEAVRIMVRLMGRPTRETNSSQASSSLDSAQRHTTSVSDKDEYRVVRRLFGILLSLVSFYLSPQCTVLIREQRLGESRFANLAWPGELDDREYPLLLRTLSSHIAQQALDHANISCEIPPLPLEFRLV